MSDPYRPDGLVTAPMWRRLAARIIDIAFSVILYWPVGMAIALALLLPFAIIDRDADQAGYHAGTTAGFISIIITFILVEWVLLVRRDGQTPGKGLMGLRVVRVSKAYEATDAATWGFAFVRMAFMVGLNYVLSVFGWILNLACVVTNRRRRALHDFAAGTRVVLAPKRPIRLGEDLLMALLIKRVKARESRRQDISSSHLPHIHR